MRAATRREATAPVGVFDSGLGGLTVLRAIRRRLPDEATVYLGDTARVPYGPKAAETIRRYAREAAAFLDSQGVKAIVVACNTATARALDAVRATCEVPVLGVIEPGARAATAATRSGRIGVIGTRGTIDSRAYHRVIQARRPETVVLGRACPLFVPLVEEGWVEGEIAEATARRYLTPLLRRRVDSLVLGCTHYPLLKPLLGRVAGPGVVLIDSAEATAAALVELLEGESLLAPAGEGDPATRYFVTDAAARFGGLARRLLGEAVDEIRRVSVDSTI